MIIGIGVDIVEVGRIQHLIKKWGERFALRILSEAELSFFSGSLVSADLLSRQFAAKEAVSKALGTGLSGIRLSDVSVLRDEKGKPIVELFGKAASEASAIGTSKIHISISDERDYAIAYVIMVS